MFTKTKFACVVAVCMLAGCADSALQEKASGATDMTELKARLLDAVSEVPGTVGIAAILPGGDTVTVNNGVRYPLMSVFKLHEALAVSYVLDELGHPLDTVVEVCGAELNPDTWSPMLSRYPADPSATYSIPVSELVERILLQSDNNASNLLFDHIVSPERTDRFIREATGLTDFAISYTEAGMKADHDLSYCNWSSPLGCAVLMDRVFTGSIVSPEKQQFVCKQLLDCKMTLNRIGVPFAGKSDVTFAHRTGSGYVNSRGELIALNDVAYIQLPDGRHYTLAVLIKDFSGTEDEASAVGARISAMVLDALQQ